MADAAFPSIDVNEPVADTNGARMDQDIQMKEEPYSEVCQAHLSRNISKADFTHIRPIHSFKNSPN